MATKKVISTRVVADVETGEVLHNAVNLRPGDIYITREEAERKQQYAAMRGGSRFHHGRKYVVSYIDTVREINEKLRLGEAGGLVKLLLHLEMYNGGIVMYRGKPAKKIDLARIMGVSKATAYRYVGKYVEVGVLTKTAEGFAINERFHVMGWVNGRPFAKLYTVKAREIIERLTLEEVGMLYHFLPYFHYTEYYLCENPNDDPANIEFIGAVKLSEIVGTDRKLVWERMKRLQRAGAVLITGTRDQTRYLIHPDLIFRQAEGTETGWTRAVRKLFADHDKKVKARKNR